MLVVLTGDTTGQLMRYKPRTGNVTVLRSGCERRQDAPRCRQDIVIQAAPSLAAQTCGGGNGGACRAAVVPGQRAARQRDKDVYRGLEPRKAVGIEWYHGELHEHRHGHRHQRCQERHDGHGAARVQQLGGERGGGGERVAEDRLH